MSLSYAVERLYEVGWVPTSGRLMQRTDEGLPYPAITDIQREFSEAGLGLSVRMVALFNCYRAEWRDKSGKAAGYCVGKSEAEAGVYALAQLIEQRQMAMA